MSLDSSTLASVLTTATEAARRAGSLLREMAGTVAAREKAPFDLVTEADVASQRLIVEAVRAAFPDHAIQAEEEGLAFDDEHPWRWIVDPLDGTVNFAHGVPLWVVSIGVAHRGEPVVGVVYHPPMDDLFAAARGLGATRNGRPIAVSREASLSRSLIVTGFPTAFADAERQIAWFRRMNQRTHSVRRTGTSAWNLALVAAGAFEVCYASAMNPWDSAAGVALVREAGGTVTGLAGEPFDIASGEILATNGLVHGEAVRALAEGWSG